MKRRLRHRIPVRLRHYWRLLATCAAVMLAFAVVFSTVRVAPLVTSASDDGGDQVTQNINGTTNLFDASVAHSIKVTVRDNDYERMLDSYWAGDEKEFLEADLTIDGTTIASVGIRLKGNSTLSGLTRDGVAKPGGLGGVGQQLGGGGAPAGGASSAAPSGAAPSAVPSSASSKPSSKPSSGTSAAPSQGGQDEAGAGRAGAGITRTSLKAEEPETLPWLIRFDEFVDGLRYQSHREIAVRVSGLGGGTTVLNEAVSLDVLAEAGEITQGYAYSSFTVNDRPTTARLIVEHPDENFADSLGGSGVLYKSLATGSFTDQGDDPTEYADDFKQITMKGSQDLQPVIDLVRWVNTSSDTEFEADLDEHIDVGSFARYNAVQNLLVNFDDMSGPGRNYYLWYDLETKKFTVVGWDYNLTFSGSADQDPHESVSMAGGGNGGTPPAGMQLPEGFQPPAGVQAPGGENANGGEFAGIGGGHKLKERFLASAAFKSVYEDAYRELYQKIYGDGTARNSLEALTKVLATVDGYDQKKTATDADELRTLIRERTEYLAGNEVIKSS